MFQMSTSGGGGYCDCGDIEAWKADYCCQTHSAVAVSSDTPVSITCCN